MSGNTDVTKQIDELINSINGTAVHKGGESSEHLSFDLSTDTEGGAPKFQSKVNKSKMTIYDKLIELGKKSEKDKLDLENIVKLREEAHRKINAIKSDLKKEEQKLKTNEQKEKNKQKLDKKNELEKEELLLKQEENHKREQFEKDQKELQRLESEKKKLKESRTKLVTEKQPKHKINIPNLPLGPLILSDPDVMIRLRKSIDAHPSTYKRQSAKDFLKKLMENLDPATFKTIEQIEAIYMKSNGNTDTESLLQYIPYMKKMAFHKLLIKLEKQSGGGDDDITISSKRFENLIGPPSSKTFETIANITPGKEVEIAAAVNPEKIVKRNDTPEVNLVIDSTAAKTPTMKLKEKSPYTEIFELVGLTSEDADYFSNFKTTDRILNEPITDKKTKRDMSDTLYISQDISINKQCLLHYFSEKKLYTNNNCDCSKKVADSLRYCQYTDNSIELNHLIKLTNDFADDTKFYRNLHEFILSVTQLMITDTPIKNAPKDTKKKIMENFKKFILEALAYSKNYRDQHKMNTDELTTICIDILFLYRLFTIRLVNYGTDTNKLKETFEQLKKATDNTIGKINELQTGSVANTKSVATQDPRIQKTIEEVEKRLKLENKLMDRLNDMLKDNDKKILEDKTFASQKVQNMELGISNY